MIITTIIVLHKKKKSLGINFTSVTEGWKNKRKVKKIRVSLASGGSK